MSTRQDAFRTKGRVNLVKYFGPERNKMIVLGILGGISANFQALTLVSVVLLAKTMISTDHHHRYIGNLGPFHLDVTTTQLSAIAAGGILIAAILDTWSSWWKSVMTNRWDFEHREQVVNEYLNADYPTQAAERLGTLGIIVGYVQRVANMMTALMGGMNALLTLLTYVGVALLIDYRAAILMVVVVALVAWSLRPVMLKIKAYSRALTQELIVYNRDITEATRMVRDLRVFDALGSLGAQVYQRSAHLARIRQRSMFVNGMVSSIYQYVSMLLVIGILFAAQSFGHVDIVKLGAIALLLVRSLSFGQSLQGCYQNVVDGIPYLDRLENLRDLYNERATRDGSVVLETVRGLELDHVSYSYDGTVKALDGVSASFNVGEIVGIVGPSGGGKSTLSQILLRLREPTSGEVKVDGVAASEYKLSSWYRHVSLVPQDPRLFHTNVANNISLFDKRITRDDIIEAAKAAGVHDVIEALEEGYETRIGPAFRDLSGGQIQRIGIARALARGSQILVLDEPTSALDVHSEAVIQATLEGLRGHALVVIIAHRLSTLSICDRIMVLREGEVETIGTLSEVSEQSDFFKRALEAGTLDVGLTGPKAGAETEGGVVAPGDV